MNISSQFKERSGAPAAIAGTAWKSGTGRPVPLPARRLRNLENNT